MAKLFECVSEGLDDLTTVTGAGTRDSGWAMGGYGGPSVRDCTLSSTDVMSTRERGVVGCDGTERGTFWEMKINNNQLVRPDHK